MLCYRIGKWFIDRLPPGSIGLGQVRFEVEGQMFYDSRGRAAEDRSRTVRSEIGMDESGHSIQDEAKVFFEGPKRRARPEFLMTLGRVPV